MHYKGGCGVYGHHMLISMLVCLKEELAWATDKLLRVINYLKQAIALRN